MLKTVKVKDFMATKLVLFKASTDIYEAINILITNKISGAPVVDESGNLVGVFSESDCLRRILHSSYYEEQGGSCTVGDYMSANVDTISPELDIVEAAEFFIANNRRRVPVVEDEKVIGLVSRRDILTAVMDY